MDIDGRHVRKSQHRKKSQNITHWEGETCIPLCKKEFTAQILVISHCANDPELLRDDVI